MEEQENCSTTLAVNLNQEEQQQRQRQRQQQQQLDSAAKWPPKEAKAKLAALGAGQACSMKPNYVYQLGAQFAGSTKQQAERSEALVGQQEL